MTQPGCRDGMPPSYEPEPDRHYPKFSHVGGTLQAFCNGRWGTGDQGRKQILRSNTTTIPILEDEVIKAPNSTEPLASIQRTISVAYRALDLTGLKKLFPFHSEMLVRDEYQRMLSHIQSLETNPSCGGVVVTGQSGMGKTFFLYYALIERILEGRPTVFQSRSNEVCLLLGPDQMYVSTGGQDVRTLVQQAGLSQSNIWALVDSNVDISRPADGLVNESFFVVHTTSPGTEGWWDWSKARGARLAVMKTWSWEEIYIGGISINNKNLSGERLRHTFTNYGPSPRRCFRLAESEDFEERWELEIPMHLSGAALGYVVENFDTFRRPSLHPEVSSLIFHIVPDGNLQPVLSVTTSHVARHVAAALRRLDYQGEQDLSRKLLDLLLSMPQSLEAAGWLWREYVLDRLLSVRTREYLTLKRLASPRQDDYPQAQETTIQVPFQNKFRYSDGASLSEALAGLTDFPTCFVPTKPGLLFFSISGSGQVTFFQSVVLGYHHISAYALELVRGAIMRAVRHLKKEASELEAAQLESPFRGSKREAKAKAMEGTEEAEANTDTSNAGPIVTDAAGRLGSTIAILDAASQVALAPLGSEQKWRVVFVVVETDGGQWTQEQPVDSADNPAQRWGHNIVQFVTTMSKSPNRPRKGQGAGLSWNWNLL